MKQLLTREIALALSKTFVDRFWASINKNGPSPTHDVPLGPCWEWSKSLCNGYGQVRDGSRTLRTHRVAWYLSGGDDIPADKYLCHKCDNRPCCRPSHLYIGEPVDNRRDATVRNRAAVGERTNKNKLVSSQVVEIRKLRQEGRTTRSLAEQFGVSQPLVSCICTRRNWTHVE